MHSFYGSKLLKALGVLAIIIVLASGCYYDKAELIYPGSTTDCSKVTATYTAVKTILAGKCNTAGCHNATSAAGSVVLETYDQAKAQAARIKQRAFVDKTMPPGAPLTAPEIAVLTCWINSNTPNN
ncbi:protein of unknown function DUF989 [Niastella koreensis GR20-10]|uniref:Cytochrome c domain-containing protein n=2 Tax=Niastella koreensis TaxID=354356 RepID=G8TI10_NIAKG|nr:hypothetical protein [Niastella koreensis]AEV99613.1 protein of unknown function DUF989 [Niastella koreensis GR20-10]